MVKKILPFITVLLALLILVCTRDMSTNESNGTQIVSHILWKIGNTTVSPDSVDSVRITQSSTSLTSSNVVTVPFSNHSVTFDPVPHNISVIVIVDGLDRAGTTIYSGRDTANTGTLALLDITIEATQVTPIAPSNLSAQALSHNSIQLVWTDKSSNENYFIVYRYNSVSSTFDSIGRVLDATYTDIARSPSTKYVYRICAANGAGHSPQTTPDSATTDMLDNIGPILTVTSHSKIDTVNAMSITLSGTVSDTSGIYQLTVNDVIVQPTGKNWIKQNYSLRNSRDTIVIKAIDNSTSRNATAETLFIFYLATFVDTTNHSPIFTVSADSLTGIIRVGDTYRRTLKAFDQDTSDTVRFVASTQFTFLGKDTIKWIPTGTNAGQVTCHALVYDKKGAKDSIAWVITVVDSNTQIPNRKPCFVTRSSDMLLIGAVGTAYKDTVLANDTDIGNHITYSVINGPAAVGSVNGIITWTPASSGNIGITIRATDDSGAYAELSWTVVVGDTNHAPIFTSTPASMRDTAYVNSMYKDTVSARDPDHNAMTYSLLTKPGSMRITDSIISWSVIITDTGTRAVRALVSDGLGKSDTLSWSVTVLDTSIANTNGLVAYYPFNGNANDASGNGNNGTVNGAALCADRFGNANSAYSFDGVSSYIDLGAPAQLTTLGLNEMTLSAWVNIDPTCIGENLRPLTIPPPVLSLTELPLL